MTLDIQTISGALKTAAENADKQGPKSYNGELDPEEISAFIKNAKDEGCSMTDILEIAKKVVPEDSPIIQQAIAECNTKDAKKNEIVNLEEQIKTLEKQLEKKKDEKEDMWPREKWQFQKPSLGTFFHGIMGAGAGAMLGLGAYMLTHVLLAKLGARKLADSKALIAAIEIPFAVAGASMMIGAGEEQGNIEPIIKKENNRPENYQDSVKYNKAEQFKQEQIVPLEQQISNLKQELKEKKAELEK